MRPKLGRIPNESTALFFSSERYLRAVYHYCSVYAFFLKLNINHIRKHHEDSLRRIQQAQRLYMKERCSFACHLEQVWNLFRSSLSHTMSIIIGFLDSPCKTAHCSLSRKIRVVESYCSTKCNRSPSCLHLLETSKSTSSTMTLPFPMQPHQPAR